MSKYRWRNMNDELSEGATDGKYVKPRPNTCSLPGNDRATLADKATLNPRDGYWHQSPTEKRKPDGTRA